MMNSTKSPPDGQSASDSTSAHPSGKSEVSVRDPSAASASGKFPKKWLYVIIGVSVLTFLAIIIAAIVWSSSSSSPPPSPPPKAAALSSASSSRSPPFRAAPSVTQSPPASPPSTQSPTFPPADTTSSASSTSSDPSTPSELPTSLDPIVSDSPSTTPELSSTVQTTTKPEAPKLIFAEVLFRHGARAPRQVSDPKFESYFPRGKGQLTDQGFNHTYLLGKFLRRRYVKTGFLDAKMNPKEMYWRSRSNQRCIQSALTVGAAMFESDTVKQVQVPVFTNKNKREFLLNTPFKCEESDNVQNDYCPNLEEKPYANSSDYEQAIYECIGKHEFFENTKISLAESYINEYENGLPVPDVVRDNIQVIHSEYMRVTSMINGVGEFFWGPRVTRRYGFLVHALQQNIKKAWKSYQANNVTEKFKAYSTQDWVIIGLLQAYGVLNHTLTTGPRQNPGYNSMIVMELWVFRNNPFVKFYYKPEEVTLRKHKMIDLTSLIPKCEGRIWCHYEKFKQCCNHHRMNKKVTSKCTFKGDKYTKEQLDAFWDTMEV